MNDRAHAALHMLTIAAVERDTRIGKDTLRVWERRYGFPAPERDERGERLYPADQVERLRHVKRLLDAGWRPGRVVPLSLAELQTLGSLTRHTAGTGPGAGPDTGDDSAPPLSAEPQALYALLRAHDVSGLRRALMQTLLRQGLSHFVTRIVPPLLVEIGQAWSRGELAVFEEHVCSEALETVLRSAIATAPQPRADAAPRVLLSTFPDESHGLALLMAEALLTVEGAACMSLGRQTPLHDIGLAAAAHRAGIVVVSVSASAQITTVLEQLTTLRNLLPPAVELWAGTPLTALQRRAPAGVRLLDNLAQVHDEVGRWRDTRNTRDGHPGNDAAA